MNANSIHLVFVYGTLKRGLGNHRVLKRGGAEFIGEDSMVGFDLYDMEWFPCVVPNEDPSSVVRGEVFRVDDETMRRLDQLEGYPHHYDRAQRATMGGHDAWIYHYDSPRGRRVESGDWQPRR